MDEVIERTKLVTYHGQLVKVRKWPAADDSLIYLPHNFQHALTLIREKKPRNLLLELTLDFPEPLIQLRKQLGLHFRKSCTGAEVVHLTEGQHSYVGEHLFVTGPCCVITCLYPRCRSYRSVGGYASLFLGDVNRAQRLASIVCPVVDPSNHSHYFSNDEKLYGNFPVSDCCPSTVVTAFVKKHVDPDGTITAAKCHLESLADTCCFGKGSSNINQFNRFVHSCLVKRSAKCAKSFAKQQIIELKKQKENAEKKARKLLAKEIRRQKQEAEKEEKRRVRAARKKQ